MAGRRRTAKLRCRKCGSTQVMPAHCSQPMHVEVVDGVASLVCWMGRTCAVAPLPQHCGLAMVPAQ